ncbi:hypothetical protein DFH29DRAFT_1067935 [Suillus ampliporus]|nr:hypothetical protein DFH29DRAFT_1067935 [Suillus ampliporus]
MDSIKDLHQQLVEKKGKITQSMDLHKSFATTPPTPWHLLPTEILSRIFEHCPPEHHYLSPSTEDAPMLLTSICRRWREITVSMSSLWCRLCVEVDHQDWQRKASGYDLWLQRSRGRPLSLVLTYRFYDTIELLNLLQPYKSQISYLRIISDHDPNTAEPLLHDLPALQVLVIRWGAFRFYYSYERDLDKTALARTISGLSTLRSLRVTGGWFRLSSSSPGAVWAHLTGVEIDRCQLNEFLHLLQLAPNLTWLAITLHIQEDVTQRPLEPFTHASLQSLFIQSFTSTIDASYSPLPVLFRALTLPSLCALKVLQSSADWPHDAFKAFLEQSKCPLEYLENKVGAITEEQRAEYVALSPSLKSNLVVLF